MKRFLLAILSVCCATLVYAQKPTQDVLYLKNGSVVKGTIMSWTGETVKIKTRDGSIFVYNSSDVESRKVEDVSITVTGKKILDFPKHSFGIRAGGIFSMTEREGMFVNPQHVICTGDEYTSETLQLNGVGFHIGGIYEVALTKTNRWFFQTGLDVQYINTIKKDSFILLISTKKSSSYNAESQKNFAVILWKKMIFLPYYAPGAQNKCRKNFPCPLDKHFFRCYDTAI